jgi:glutamyl-Q tRNA(Asp) synthetase
MIQGKIQQDITRDSGDFIVVRSDQVFSYNLVAAIDDAHGITHVIRGADLLDTTPKQVYLQNLLKISTPVYGHIPVAVNKDGKKLSKQHGAIDVLDEYTPAQALVRALKFLGQPIDNGLSQAPPDTIIQWALENWSLELIPKLASIQI